MDSQECKCNRCKKVLYDPVTTGCCQHAFCTDCLRILAESSKQGVMVTRRCVICYRDRLHNLVDIRCPVCQTSFRYNEPMPGEYFFLMLMSLQMSLAASAMFLAVLWLCNGLSFCSEVFSASLLGSAAYAVYIEVTHWRHCCAFRKISVLFWLFLLTAPGCWALFESSLAIIVCVVTASFFVRVSI